MIPVDIDVWLETQRTLEKIRVIPYVRTAEEIKIDYRIELVRNSAGGSTRISQSGNVSASARSPGQMGVFSIDTHPANGTCGITITLTSALGSLGNYKFDCPS